MSSTPMDFKQQMAEARRKQILMGAAEVFAEKGFHQATTKEIAANADVSEGTIYNYFDNKRELLVAMLELIATQSLKTIIDGDLPKDPKEFITWVIRDRYQLAEKYGYLLAPILAEIFVDAELREAVYQQIAIPIAGHLEKYLQAQIEAGRVRQIDPVIVTRAFVGMLLINFALKLTSLDSRYEKISADSLIEQLASLFLEGILPDEAQD